jgi:hypothetical protein
MSSTPMSPTTDRESSGQQETAPSSPPSESNEDGLKDEMDEETAGVNAAIDEMSQEEGEEGGLDEDSKSASGSVEKSQKGKGKGRKTKTQQRAAVEKEQKSQFESLEKLLNKSQVCSVSLVSCRLRIKETDVSGCSK